MTAKLIDQIDQMFHKSLTSCLGGGGGEGLGLRPILCILGRNLHNVYLRDDLGCKYLNLLAVNMAFSLFSHNHQAVCLE